MKINKNLLLQIKTYLIIMAGGLLMAGSLNLFSIHNKIAPGGVSGIATILHYLINAPVGITIIIINIPLFIWGLKDFGLKFSIKTIFATVFYSLVTDLTAFLPAATNNPLLAAIFGGVLMGLGMGLVLNSGATTGGADLTATLLNKKIPFMSIGRFVLIIDIIIVTWATIVFNSIELGLYAVVYLVISSYVIDAVMEGIDFAKSAFIISDKCEEIGNAIIKQLNRSGTLLNGTGVFTGSEKKVIMCVVKRYELPKLKSLIKEIDNEAFITLSDVKEVLGKGFKDLTGKS